MVNVLSLRLQLLESVILERHRLEESSFFEIIENLMKISKMLRKIEKMCFVSAISACELVALKCLY